MGVLKNKFTLFIFIFCFIIINLYLANSIIKANNINNNIVRLHVVSNSDSTNDQIIKLKISTIVENYINNLNLNNMNTSQIIKTLNDKKEDILLLVNSKLREENINYKATISIGKIYYNDEKDNAIYHMEKGTYNSIKITLGAGEGKNFWSFIAPSEENLRKLKEYESILPGINKLIKSFDNYEEYNEIIYKSKFLELIKYNNGRN